MADTDRERAQQIVISVLREMLDAERARSERYRDALVRVATWHETDEGRDAYVEAVLAGTHDASGWPKRAS